MGFLTSKLGAYLGGVLVLVLAAAWGYHVVYQRGVDGCEAAQRAAAAQAAAQDHTNYVAAIAWGSQVSAELAAKQHQIETLKVRHEYTAHIIPGVCPDGLRVLHDAAAAGIDIPEPAGPTSGTSGLIAASAIGSAVAINYATCRENESRLDAWIKWCRGVPGCAP